MWTCPICDQKFLRINQHYSCNERTLDDFLHEKSAHILDLFYYFIEEYKKIGAFELHPSRSRIAFAAKIRFGYIHRLGKQFLDVVLTFPKPYHDNLCFYRIGAVPGGKIFQHYLRIMQRVDINEEVRYYMKRALDWGNKLPIP